MSNINISGTIGVSFLKKNDKKVVIFYDDHSNTQYCDNSYFINDFFDEINTQSNIIVLLEEPLLNEKDKENIIFLWDNVPHIVKSKNFYKKVINQCTSKKVCRVFPVDVRLCFIDVSLEEYFTKNDPMDDIIFTNNTNNTNNTIKTNLLNNADNKNKVRNINIKKISKKYNNKFEKNFTEDIVKDYFKYFIYLFDKEKVDTNKFSNTTNIYFIKEIFETFTDNDFYKQMKNKFDIFYNKFIKQNENIKMIDFIKQYKSEYFEYKRGFPFINDDENNFVTQFNRIHNSMMEFYSVIIIIYSNYKNIIMYSGYYHSNNISYILKNHFGFLNEKNIGYVDNINYYDENTIKNCIKVNKDIIEEYLK